ncbi:pentapeptide repeat-containing protein [Limnofasciculus baicalensis]|uniref:Pentapeptide repeat-containing protein n=1 Tax=Limnofasciculus baicalensis BBK-W-15 TaxID=2699891 RepID=A0AAE3GYE3_9CYAN|nr:pentapeptide repeat-containing protein [Limnofasciculus baicalensis]MCP2732096.1 pentapeptide repeat-containing protein [Limnofasciculus baicalensis BBK-W-15]
MNGRILSGEYRSNSVVDKNQFNELNIAQSQDIIYKFLLDIVNQAPPETVLVEFKQLFLLGNTQTNPHVNQAFSQIVSRNNEEEFRNTLKRSYYILINNWSAKRKYQEIENLVQILADIEVNPPKLSENFSYLGRFLSNFIKSQDYEELKLFTSPHSFLKQEHWSERYRSYLLVPQYLDAQNPIEQREIAKDLSKRLKKKFKFELAMYTARCNSPKYQEEEITNPTKLGNQVIHLIKKVSSQQLSFSYLNQASLFLRQVKNVEYREFKQSFKKYLVFSHNNNNYLKLIELQFFPKLNNLYEKYNHKPLTDDLLLRTCRRAIEFMTTEDGEQPSSLFIALTMEGNPLFIVITLLKITLICKSAQNHLEVSIARLIKYYEKFPENECQWFIHFLETFNIVLTLYNEDIHYDLVKINGSSDDFNSSNIGDKISINLDAYRVFSQLKGTDLRGAELRGADIRSTDLMAADLRDAELSDADLSYADLSLAKLSNANLSRATLEHTDLSGAMLNRANLSDANLKDADLRCAHLRQTKLNRANLTNTNIRRAELQQAELNGANLSGASLNGSDFRGADMQYANLSDADLSNANFSNANLSDANLKNSQLRHTRLNHANLTGANLIGANLTHASLIHADLSRADLSRVDLSHGNLSGTDLRNAVLRHVNLSSANLSHADLRGAKLFGTNLSGVNIHGTQFGNNSGLSEEMKLQLEQQGAIIDRGE